MDNPDDRYEEIQRQLATLPQDVVAAIGVRPTDEQWPEPPPSSGSMPDVAGSSVANQIEPLVSRMEGVARLMEQRLGDQAAGWGSPPKVFEQQSLSGLIGQMPVTSAIGFADQSFGISPHSGEGSRPFGDPIHVPSQPATSGSGQEPVGMSQPAAASTMGVPIPIPAPVASSTAGVASIPSPPTPPAPVPAQASTTTEGGGDVSGATAQILEHIVQAIEMLADKLADKTAANQPGDGSGARGQPDAFPGTRPEGPTSTPELQPGAVPSWKDAHQGGAARPWWEMSRG